MMVAKNGGIFLADFGLARMVETGESTLSQDMMVGTPQYISPEQAQGITDLDGRTDIYSLGVVLFEMLTGQVPFNADTPFATIHDHIYTPLPLPSSLNPDLDPATERLLLKALAKDPNDRFESAETLLAALETTLGPKVDTEPPAAAPREQKPKSAVMPWWTWTGGVIILVLVMFLLIGLFVWRLRSRNLAVVNPQPASGQLATPAPATVSPNAGLPLSEEAASLTKQAADAIQQSQFDEATTLYEQAISIDPTFLPAYFGLSELLRITGDDAGALKSLEEAVANNPEDARAYARLGQAQLVEVSNPEAALVSFQQASALEPQAPIPYAGQGLAYLEMEENKKAKDAIDTALALDPRSLEAHFANALYLAREGKRLLAVRELRQIIQDRRTSSNLRKRASEIVDKLSQ